MEFTKAHGTANDFVVIADLDDSVDLTPALVRALCDRRRGIGADGVLRIAPPSDAADVFMDYRNADGSVVEMCGNGVRVVAKHVVDHGLVTVDDIIRIGTRAGVRGARVGRGGDGRVETVTVAMGPPAFEPADVPFDAARPGQLSEPVDVDGDTVEITALSMGNPHAVIVVDDVDSAPVERLGPALEHDRRFPERTNVEFVQPVDDGHARLRVWERGVGETASCGTGVCAAAVALHRLGRAGREVEIHAPGGTLTVVWEEAGEVRLTGPAVEVAHGSLDAAWLAAARTAEAATRQDVDDEVLY